MATAAKYIKTRKPGAPEAKAAPSSAPLPNGTYAFLQRAYNHFNKRLFGDELPPCLITMQRHKGAYGYFASARFARVGDDQSGKVDEIALNPVHFQARSSLQTLSTLAHEMAHLWQFRYGKPSRGGYHNHEWADKMVEIGLQPTDTGSPGGKVVGQRVTHMIIDSGPFAKACDEFLGSTPLELYGDTWTDEEKKAKAGKVNQKNKYKYTCGTCHLNAWAKHGANLFCGDCSERMEPEVKPEGDDA